MNNSNAKLVAATLSLLLLVACWYSYHLRERLGILTAESIHHKQRTHTLERRLATMEVAGKRDQSSSASQAKESVQASGVSNAETNSSDVLEAVGQLKRLVQLHPDWAVPEFILLKDEDWLNVASQFPIDTEYDERRALDVLRQMAAQKFLPELRAAETANAASNEGKHALNPGDLKAYLQDPTHAAMLDRYSAFGGNLGEQTDYYFKYSGMSDPYGYTNLYIGPGGKVGFNSAGLIQDAFQAFQKQNGRPAKTPQELRPFLPQGTSQSYLDGVFRHHAE